jgi:prepilin-type N-terminal cleavage/methylation domain-containing protein
MKKGFTLVEIMIVVAIIGLLAAIAIPSFMKARTTSQKNACINNLRQIESAKDQYSIEVGRTSLWAFASDADAFSNLVGASTGYIKIAPSCPASSSTETKGTTARADADYTVNPISSNPICTVVTDHRL